MDKLPTDNILGRIPLEAKTPMLQFIKDTALEQGFAPYEMVCRPEDVPSKVEELSNKGARIMVGALGTEEARWTTGWMNKKGLINEYKTTINLLESKKSSCVPFALKTLGFNVSQQTSDEVAYGYDRSVKLGQNYHGHVLAIKPCDLGFEVTDQHGSGIINKETLILMSQFRATRMVGDLNSGYIFLK